MRRLITALAVGGTLCVLLALVACGTPPAAAPDTAQAREYVPPAKSRDISGATVTYDMLSGSTPFRVVTAITTNANTFTASGDDFTIVHLGYREDGQTASSTGDYVLLARVYSTGTTTGGTDLNLADGVKAPIFPGGSITFPSDYVPQGKNGPHEVQFQAIGHGAKLLVIRGRK